jgi:hypothetical protein
MPIEKKEKKSVQNVEIKGMKIVGELKTSDVHNINTIINIIEVNKPIKEILTKPGDCVTVASSIVKPLQDGLEKINFPFFDVGLISVDEKVRMKNFEREGFTKHTINYVEFSETKLLALDYTQKVVIIAKNLKDLKDKLKSYYQTTNTWKTSNE